jgi:hypothetical protein
VVGTFLKVFRAGRGVSAGAHCDSGRSARQKIC